jgi:glycosyltransferase involved in cell wall biosynthesis
VRILYIHQFFATRDSSHPTRSYEFARRMVADGHDVTMVTGASRLGRAREKRPYSRFDVDGIDVRAVRNSYSNYMGYPRRMVSFAIFSITGTLAALGGPRPDVVFATSTPLTVGIPGYLVSRLRRAPFVFEVRDLWPEAAIQMGALGRDSLLARVARALERFIYHKADAVIGLSPGMTAGIIDAGKDPAAVHTIPNCSDLDLFHPGAKDPEMLTRLGTGERFAVGYAGAIGPSNAVDVVTRAAAILRERGRADIVFVLAGDGKSLPAIREHVEAEGLDNVKLVGSLPKHDVPPFLRSCDALMTLFADVPILATNSPNKFFDGLASGRPMIVNSPGWTKGIVEDDDAGVHIPADDPRALADAVAALADDRTGAEAKGKNARETAERLFGRDDMARKLIAVLEDAVAARRGASD